MRIRTTISVLGGCLLASHALGDVAKHTTVNMNASGAVTEYTEMVASDNGDLRVEIYKADAAGNRGPLDSLIVFDAAAKKMLTSSGGTCQTMDLAGETMPGGMSRDDVSAMQAEMMRALEEMRTQNPEMAKMLEEQMGPGMAGMMSGEPQSIRVVETGEERTIAGYDTTGFRMEGMPVAGDYTVWAADVDKVEGGRTMARASQAMMQAHKQMMENMGVAEIIGGNVFSEILDAMDDYYPIESGNGSTTTRLVSTSGGGTEDFSLACN